MLFGPKREKVNFIMRILMICNPTNEIGGACSTCGGGEKRVQGFGGKT
jgi:hypothetical protein